MQGSKRYPSLKLRSKNEIAKRISGKDLSYDQALSLINNVLNNFNSYWYDSKHSEPDKNKFVRSAIGTPLGQLLGLIDAKILAPNDRLVPEFIFGGLSGKNHIQAAYYLLGKKRTLLKLDIKGFFELIKKERVFYFFYKKCGCSKQASTLLSNLCCVPSGPKGSKSEIEILARGFATSPRLALWSNMDLFIRLNWEAKKMLRGHDPKIAIFVDDIGVAASGIDENTMEVFSKKIEDVLFNFDKNQQLPINPKKKEIVSYKKNIEHLGLRLGRRKVTMGKKTKYRFDMVREKLKNPLLVSERNNLLKKHKAYQVYKRQIIGTGKGKIFGEKI